MLTDEQIIRRVLDGYGNDFREIMTRYGEPVYRVACRMLGSRDAALDVSQEAFLKAYQRLSSYSGRGRFGGWLRRMVVNTALDKIRTEIPTVDIEQFVEQDRFESNPVETQVPRDREVSEIRKRIYELPGGFRTAIVLRYHEGLSYKEISEAMGEPMATVQRRLHRAKLP